MIFISAGHHEEKQGASYKDITEYQLTVLWADNIAKLIKHSSLRVPNGTLKEKVGFINTAIVNSSPSEKHIAVEIHFNSAKVWRDGNANGVIDDGEMRHVGRGSETLYYPSSKTGKRAASIIQSALGSLMKPDRGIKEGYYQMNKSKGADFFLAKTKCTSLIIEPEFIDNIELILNNEDAACHSIASSLLECIS